jgi:hypothetical protein
MQTTYIVNGEEVSNEKYADTLRTWFAKCLPFEQATSENADGTHQTLYITLN